MKTETEIEELLTRGKKLTLEATDKSSIKMALLEHAQKTLKQETQSVVSPWSSWVFKTSFSMASLLLGFVGTGYASQESLPGEPLYAMKVHVVEEMIGLTKTDVYQAVTYDITLMETRLEELQKVADQEESLTPTELAVFTNQIDEHVAHITTNLQTADATLITPQEKIDTLAKLSSITNAQKRVVKDETHFTTISDTVSKSHESTTQALTSAIEDFVTEESEETVGEYLHDQITEAGEQVHASSTDENTRDFASRHLFDVDEALVDGDIQEALISILEAREVLDVDMYLDEAALDTSTQEATQ